MEPFQEGAVTLTDTTCSQPNCRNVHRGYVTAGMLSQTFHLLERPWSDIRTGEAVPAGGLGATEHLTVKSIVDLRYF